MNYKFKNNVAMKVTKEQFNNDLKQPLSEMGFADETWGSWNEYNTLLTMKKSEKFGNYCYPDVSNIIDIDIDYYNPQLFLALVAMTNEEKGNIGEYWYFFGEKAELFKKGELYKQSKPEINNLFALLDDNDTQNGFCGKNLQNFRKATVEEIMKKFNKKVCFKSDGTKKTGIEIIEELEKLGGKNKQNYKGDSNMYPFYYIGEDGSIISKSLVPKNYELISLNKEKIMKNRILTPANATKIINVACSTWKPKLAEKWATNIVLNKDTEISEEFYQEMRKACTTDQNDLFDEIFGKDEQLISPNDLAIGEAMKICDGGSYNGIIISRIWSDDNPRYVNVNNTSSTWKGYPDFKGKKVKLTITHEEVK